MSLYSVNKVTLVGNVGKADFDGTRQILKFSVATENSIKKGDEWVKTTDWHNCIMFGKSADVLKSVLKAGSKVYIDGAINYSNYEKNGVKMYSTSILVSKCIIFDKNNTTVNNTNEVPDDFDQDVPF